MAARGEVPGNAVEGGEGVVVGGLVVGGLVVGGLVVGGLVVGGCQPSGGTICTMLPHLGHSRIWPITPTSRTLSRAVQVVHVTVNRAIACSAGEGCFFVLVLVFERAVPRDQANFSRTRTTTA
jgi:hypothetical protein